MPNKDGTGPEGKGARTGRGFGNCKSTSQESNSQENNFQRGQGLEKRRKAPQ